MCSELLRAGPGGGSFPFSILGKFSKVPEAEVKHPAGLLPTWPGPILLKSWRKRGRGQSVVTALAWKFFENLCNDHCRVHGFLL